MASLALIICLLAMPLGAWGASDTWIGGTGVNYTTGANWTSGTAPIVAGDVASFAVPVNLNVTINAGLGIRALNVSGANNYQITSAQAVTLTATAAGAGGLLTTSTGTLT